MIASVAQNRISVIMPCYNAAAFVEQAVECVMNQSYGDVELIVVDDGSTDGSLDILARLVGRYSPRIAIYQQNRKGPYPARNLGLEHASGGRIAFLDADDYWAPDALERLAGAMERHDADVAYCGWQNVGEGAPGVEPFVPPDYSLMDTAVEFLRTCPWPIHAALVRRDAVAAINGFSERAFSSMDYDLWLRLYADTEKLVRVPQVLAFYRWHDQGQISKTKWKQVVNAVQVRHDFVAENPERVAHLSAERVREMTDGVLLREAYRAYWQRSLVDAQKLFRRAFARRVWKLRDLKYLAPALLPGCIFQRIVRSLDRLNTGKR